MGRITNEFTCVEFTIYPDYERGYDEAYEQVDADIKRVQDTIEECEFKDFFNLVLGSNGNIYFTAAPSGSKVGWDTSAKHAKEVKQVVDLIQEVASYSVVNKTVTSDG